ncbi:MAG: M1 family metallopeptidase [Chitinophagales bacterium]
MKFTFPIYISIITFFAACNDGDKQQKNTEIPKPSVMYANDPHSYAKPNDIVVKHLDLSLQVDFDSTKLKGFATWTVQHTTDATLLILDTRNLKIQSVVLVNGDEEVPAEFSMGDSDSVLGSALLIDIPKHISQTTIYYETTPGADALQWLKPEQTAEKTSPFLFTQSQAILCRTWIPCQDGPGVRFTYNATIITPKGNMAVMSAENPTEKSADGVYHFKMPQPIPSYLMALAVGDFVFKPIGAETGVYAQPSMIDKCVYEFADMQKMLETAEKLYGNYEWGRYDVIVLPPSFPFGGMENPRITFATPTIISGDRSLVALIAHEMAHSWSGNLVTNATWDDFWLNEGFTVYFENRIMEALYGNDYEDMLEVLGKEDLIATVADLGNTSADTHLKLNLAGRNPDDGMNDIAYEKGNLFLKLLEQTVGREKFDAFVNNWFHENKFQSRTTEDFVSYLNKNLIEPNKEKFSGIDVQEWIYKPGIPANCPVIISENFNKVDGEAKKFNEGATANTLQTNEWSTHEWLRFLQQLPDTLSLEKISKLDETFHFTNSGNAEIADEWFLLCLNNQYRKAYPAIENFLCNIGRRKFLTPLYKAMVNTNQKELALKIYEKARPGYHAVSQATMDELLGLK